MAAKKKQSFEEAVAELEATVDKLERDEGITLDESIKLFTRGVELARACNAILEEAEGRIVKLVEDGGRMEPPGAGGGPDMAAGGGGGGVGAGGGFIEEGYVLRGG